MFRLVLAAGMAAPLLSGGSAVADSPPRLPAASNDAAWRKLPGAPAAVQPLPAWARVLAGWQPITTARMLELDALHRSGERLDGRFRAVVRWAAADANRCEYAKAMAAADYDRAAGHPADLGGLMATPGKLPEADRLGAAFARKMMLDAAGVTDAEVKRLIELLGDERVVALVALVAHASFQDRVLLALRVEPEAGGVPPPVTVKFDRPKAKPPAHPPAAGADTPPAAAAAPPDHWLKTRDGLESQRRRPGRIAVPAPEVVAKRMGAGHPGLWQNGILWSRVCYGHQPELTDAWFDTANAFRQEAGMDPVFSNAVFWVVTDSLRCFY
jgi:alkylhydroperoxidase family enzyme